VNATLFGMDALTYKRNEVDTTEDWKDYTAENWLDVDPSLNYALA